MDLITTRHEILCFNVLVVVKWCGHYISLFETGRNKSNVLYVTTLQLLHLTTQFFLSLHLLYIFNDNNEFLLILPVQKAKTKLQKNADIKIINSYCVYVYYLQSL